MALLSTQQGTRSHCPVWVLGMVKVLQSPQLLNAKKMWCVAVGGRDAGSASRRSVLRKPKASKPALPWHLPGAPGDPCNPCFHFHSMAPSCQRCPRTSACVLLQRSHSLSCRTVLCFCSGLFPSDRVDPRTSCVQGKCSATKPCFQSMKPEVVSPDCTQHKN